MLMRDNDALLLSLKIDPAARRKFAAVLEDVRGHGVPLAVVEVYRSPVRQLMLYCQGRTDEQLRARKVRQTDIAHARASGYTANKPIVTMLKTPRMHGRGRAMDCAFVIDGRLIWNAPGAWWEMYGRAARAHGLKWGGDWKTLKDKPHVEWRG